MPSITISVTKEERNWKLKAMPLLRRCNTGRTCVPFYITTREQTSLPVHVVQKITIIPAQKIGKSAV